MLGRGLAVGGHEPEAHPAIEEIVDCQGAFVQ
jgi:hypothetical protein